MKFFGSLYDPFPVRIGYLLILLILKKNLKNKKKS